MAVTIIEADEPATACAKLCLENIVGIFCQLLNLNMDGKNEIWDSRYTFIISQLKKKGDKKVIFDLEYFSLTFNIRRSFESVSVVMDWLTDFWLTINQSIFIHSSSPFTHTETSVTFIALRILRRNYEWLLFTAKMHIIINDCNCIWQNDKKLKAY